MNQQLVFKTLLAAFRGIAEDLHYKPLAHALNLPYRVKTCVNDDDSVGVIQFCLSHDQIHQLMDQISIICFDDSGVKLRLNEKSANAFIQFRKEGVLLEIRGQYVKGVGWKFFIVVFHEELLNNLGKVLSEDFNTIDLPEVSE